MTTSAIVYRSTKPYALAKHQRANRTELAPEYSLLLESDGLVGLSHRVYRMRRTCVLGTSFYRFAKQVE